MMKKISLNVIILFLCFSSIAQDRIIKDYGYFLYSLPKKNWTITEPIKVGSNKTWGCQTFDLGKTANLTVTETPNDLPISNAHELEYEDIKNVVLNVFSDKSTFGRVENRTISGVNCKYVKAMAVVSNGTKVSSINHVLFYKNRMFLIQGIYTSINEDEYLPILSQIINSIKLK